MPLYAFGSNGSGQLGIGHAQDVATPTPCLFRDSSGRAVHVAGAARLRGGGTIVGSERAPYAAACRAGENGKEEEGEEAEEEEEEEAEEEEEDDDDVPVKIAAGGNHTLLLFASGRAFAAGAVGEALFAAGRPVAETGGPPRDATQDRNLPPTHTLFRQIAFADPASGQRVVDRFADLAATWDASFFLAAATHQPDSSATEPAASPQRLYVHGAGAKGELGLGPGVTSTRGAVVRAPCFPPPAGLRVRAMHACVGHVAVALSDGSVCGWGAARKGQLGEQAAAAGKVAWAPTRVCGPEAAAVAVACGREFTIVVSARDDAAPDVEGGGQGKMACAEGTARLRYFGPRGVQDRWALSSSAHLADGSARLHLGSLVAASWHTVYLLPTPDHEPRQRAACRGGLMAWGRNDRGQVPPPGADADADADAATTLVDIAAGSEHVLALTARGQVLAAGWGEHGNCGPQTDSDGDVKGRWAAVDIELDNVTARQNGEVVIGVGAGCATSWIITRRLAAGAGLRECVRTAPSSGDV
ncbi:hypothetical protein KEM52_006540 [Ascosphaera acerosa]|nr:hypothetical protein KEM52_006540 [Ascosphaera acerosa]